LHSFPTRRSSDLEIGDIANGKYFGMTWDTQILGNLYAPLPIGFGIQLFSQWRSGITSCPNNRPSSKKPVLQLNAFFGHIEYLGAHVHFDIHLFELLFRRLGKGRVEAG